MPGPYDHLWKEAQKAREEARRLRLEIYNRRIKEAVAQAKQMAENQQQSKPEDTLEIPTPWGGHIKANGWNIIIVMALMALTYVIFDQNKERANEHDEVICYVRLHLYVSGLPAEKPIVWRDMPSDLYKCVPNFNITGGR